MNERIEKAYAQRPKRWVFELSVAVIVTALIVWSATAVETSGCKYSCRMRISEREG